MYDRNQAGAIGGTLTHSGTTGSIVVYAYENGTWVGTEDDAPATGSARFLNAVSSAVMKSDSTYILPYLAPGTYDLAVVLNNPDGSFNSVLGFVPDVAVTSKTTTTANINTAHLSMTP